MGFLAIVALLEKMAKKLGIEFKWMKKKQEDRDLLLNTVQRMNTLEEQRNVDVEQSILHDKAIKADLLQVSTIVDSIDQKLDEMKRENDATKMEELKGVLLSYYRKYKNNGEWSKLENDAFWGLFARYEAHGGNGHMHDVVEPIMRELKVID